MKVKIFLRPFLRPLIRWLLYFRYETHYYMGSGTLKLGKKVATANTLFNLSSGDITIENYTIFGQNVSVVTGVHKFSNGTRAGLELVKNTPAWGGGELEVPARGNDITIGEGCWIASGAMVLGGTSIGAHSIVMAGAVVTKSFPPHSIIAGVPAKLRGSTKDL